MAKPAQPAPKSATKPTAASNKVPPPQAPKSAPPPLAEKVPTGEQKGFIVMVNPKEGYGFIRPEANRNVEGKDVHFSLRQVEGHKNVRQGQAVSYYVTRSDKGVTAIKVRPGSALSIPYLKFLLIGVVSALALLAGLVIVLDQPASLPLWLALWVAAFSIATYGVYAYDKGQAQSSGLRVPEAVLHLMGALGGTPGAFIAMRTLHHKTKKQQFQVIFWLIVAAQAALLIWWFLLR
jgi:uncharacterized membrane protein YsdA (DUF1294 family)/cold shock CspA family protein